MDMFRCTREIVKCGIEIHRKIFKQMYFQVREKIKSQRGSNNSRKKKSVCLRPHDRSENFYDGGIK
jgi:hypothetical protein